MSRFKRCACGRWKATDRQIERWSDWCYDSTPAWRHYVAGHEPLSAKLWRNLRRLSRTPLWWHLQIRCMGWYDCRDGMTRSEWKSDYPRLVRWLFRMPPLPTREEVGS